MKDSNQTLQTLKAALDDVGAAGEAARLQLHLLSMRARARTDGIAASIEALERKLDRNIEKTVLQAASKTRQLSGAVRELLGQTLAAEEPLPKVQAIMSEAVWTCSPDDALSVPARVMWEHDCGAVPVVSKDGKVVSIVTDRDICMATYTKGLPPAGVRVGDIMCRHVHACGPEDSLERAAALMAEAQVRRLPVVDAERRLLGIVSLADIARSAPVLGRAEAAELVFRLLRSVSQPPHAGAGPHSAAAE